MLKHTIVPKDATTIVSQNKVNIHGIAGPGYQHICKGRVKWQPPQP